MVRAKEGLFRDTLLPSLLITSRSMSSTQSTKSFVRILYALYLMIATLIGLVMVIVTTSQLINMGLKTWVFPAADLPEYIQPCHDVFIPDRRVSEEEFSQEELREQCETRRAEEIENYQLGKARDAVSFSSAFVVGLPLFLIHYRLFRRERGERGDTQKKSKAKK